MLKRALLTGATGFIGKNLAKQLVEEGWEVYALVRPSSVTDELQALTKDKIKIVIFDDKRDNLIDLLKKIKPQVVFHLASLFLAQHNYADIADLIESNIGFGTRLLEAMAKNNIIHLVNTGTSWQHYQNEDYNPVCLYAATKQAFEMIIKYYQATADLKVIDLKLFDTYGENDTRRKLLYLLQEAAENDLPLSMSPGEQLIDLVHVSDVVRAFILAGEYLVKGQYEYLGEYAVTSGKLQSLQELVSDYEKYINKKLKIDWGGRPYREREVMIPWNTGKTLPGWEINRKLGDD